MTEVNSGITATPLGQAAYGILFELMGQNVYLLFFGVTVLLGLFSLALRGTFVKVEDRSFYTDFLQTSL